MKYVANWTGTCVECSLHTLHWNDDNPFASTNKKILAYGSGCSYGDVCLPCESAISCSALDRILWFDREHGIVRAEAGVKLGELASVLIQEGWNVPVLPGTGHVTVGGAIANDIHGKNHHWAGTFGCWVRRFELLRADGRYICSPSENHELFCATIGGLGLTGIITWAELELVRFQSPVMECAAVPFRSLQEYFELSIERERIAPYVVAWCDLSGGGCVHGTIYSATPSKSTMFRSTTDWQLYRFPPLRISVINRLTVRCLNTVRRWRDAHKGSYYQSWHKFFFPLDRLPWNQLFGKKGFFQFQAVFPRDNRTQALSTVIELLQRSELPLALCVLKNFGERTSPGILSFPIPGTSIAVDIPNLPKAHEILRQLLAFTASAGGRIYPAKDALMLPEHFQRMYPQWHMLERLREARCCSRFWQRVTQGILL